jgi:hypothetical protein
VPAPALQNVYRSLLCGVRPDIRDKTAVLTKYLIERHLKTLNDNFHIQKVDSSSFDGFLGNGFVLANDDDSCFGFGVSPSGKRRIPATTSGSPPDNITFRTYYYPFMHRTLETLGRVVLASVSNLATYSESKSKILALWLRSGTGTLFPGS